tara:strand:- start:217 stop:813 length:597 start_codon:yes stop_codon:yes gene_type:complete
MIEHYHYDCVASTNTTAKQFASQLLGTKPHLPNNFSGAVFTADEQTQGRGRGDHSWYSAPYDGLYYSLLIPPPEDYQNLSSLTTQIGTITIDSIQHLTATQPQLEWPNDIILNQKKLGGILIESVGRSNTASPQFVVIGIGLNLNHSDFPKHLQFSATSLYQVTQKKYDQSQFIIFLTQTIYNYLFKINLELKKRIIK